MVQVRQWVFIASLAQYDYTEGLIGPAGQSLTPLLWSLICCCCCSVMSSIAVMFPPLRWPRPLCPLSWHLAVEMPSNAWQVPLPGSAPSPACRRFSIGYPRKGRCPPTVAVHAEKRRCSAPTRSKPDTFGFFFVFFLAPPPNKSAWAPLRPPIASCEPSSDGFLGKTANRKWPRLLTFQITLKDLEGSLVFRTTAWTRWVCAWTTSRK